MRRATDHPHCRGFSLVELMVALTVSLLLLAGVLQILLSNRESFDAQRATARVQENARLAEFVLEHAIAHAGYYTELDNTREAVFPAETTAPAYEKAGAVIAAESDTQGKNDTLRLRFQARGGVRDCRGDEVGSPAAAQQVDLAFYVNASHSLICHIVSGDSQPIAENVDRFEVSYGLDTDAVPGVDQYRSTLYGAQALQVKSIRVQLLLHSDDADPALPTAAERQFFFADAPRKAVIYRDRLARMLVDETVALQNTSP